MFSKVPNGAVVLNNFNIISVIVIITGMLIFHWRMRNTNVLAAIAKMPSWLLGLFWALMLGLLILSQESSSSFIYFQF